MQPIIVQNHPHGRKGQKGHVVESKAIGGHQHAKVKFHTDGHEEWLPAEDLQLVGGTAATPDLTAPVVPPGDATPVIPAPVTDPTGAQGVPDPAQPTGTQVVPDPAQATDTLTPLVDPAGTQPAGVDGNPPTLGANSADPNSIPATSAPPVPTDPAGS